MKLDAVREYIKNIDIQEKERNALLFSMVLSMNDVFNNPNDQKSSLKKWTQKSLKPVIFKEPTSITGIEGVQYNKDIFSFNGEKYDIVYLDPPYTHGVLYPACYHLNDSVVLWDKPILNYDYALPRPERACFRDKNPQNFYSKTTAFNCFNELFRTFSNSKKIILSYSNAPRNCISLESLVDIANSFGKTEIFSIEHKICTQPKTLNKVSKELKEVFIIVDL